MRSNLSLIVVVLSVSTALGQSQLDYDDGAAHRHGGIDDPFVEVSQSTQVDVVDPADIAFLRVHDTSHVGQSGGHVSHISLFDSATFTFTGGDFSHLNVADSSQAELRGGKGAHVRAYDDSTVNVYDGKYDFVTADELHPESTEGDGSIVNIHGGSIGVVKTYWPSTMNILSGDIIAINPLSAGATTNVHGGSIRDFTLNHSTVTNVFGTRLELTPNGSVHGTPRFILSGQLEDGSMINADVVLPSRAQLNLIIVPEPKSLSWFAAIICLIPWLQRRTKQPSDLASHSLRHKPV